MSTSRQGTGFEWLRVALRGLALMLAAAVVLSAALAEEGDEPVAPPEPPVLRDLPPKQDLAASA